MSVLTAAAISALIGFVAATIVFAILKRKERMTNWSMWLWVNLIGVIGVGAAYASRSVSNGLSESARIACFAALLVGVALPWWRFMRRPPAEGTKPTH